MPGEVCRPEGAGARACGAAAGASGPHAEDPRLGGLWGLGTRGERTPNMPAMSVTRYVSKLSGWLKASAYCRVERRAQTMWADVRAGRGVGGGAAQRRRKWHARGWLDSSKARGGQRARAERTQNMPLISVTLDVSKLSSWLKADAPCRVERRAQTRVGRGVRASGGCMAARV